MWIPKSLTNFSKVTLIIVNIREKLISHIRPSIYNNYVKLIRFYNHFICLNQLVNRLSLSRVLNNIWLALSSLKLCRFDFFFQWNKPLIKILKSIGLELLEKQYVHYLLKGIAYAFFNKSKENHWLWGSATKLQGNYSGNIKMSYVSWFKSDLSVVSNKKMNFLQLIDRKLIDRGCLFTLDSRWNLLEMKFKPTIKEILFTLLLKENFSFFSSFLKISQR